MKNGMMLKIIQGFTSVALLLLLSQCAWFRSDQKEPEIIKPTPVGGYELLSTKIYYPKDVREKGIEGKIDVRAKISQNGQVLDAKVVKPLDPDLDRIAVNAVKRTPFNPATRDGVPLEVWISIPIKFALENWQMESTPFSRFEMLVFPNTSYENFEVQLKGVLKTDLELPVRFEILLPLNAERAWITKAQGKYEPERVRDENGEWLIFNLNEKVFDLGYKYQALDTGEQREFRYKFMMNQALPPWDLTVIYGDQNVRFSQKPDRSIEDEQGRRRVTYELSSMEPYEARYLEVALQE